ncbi:MAG: uroporphyrinogen-III synthase, partial [Nitrospinae bacterium]|nr:uroporphyrinogen-III synthase [Nitrospinota bacterium]
ELLEKEGAITIQFPTIETIPPDSWDALDNAIKKLDTYQWLIFTSANGVRFFIERLKFNGKDIRELKGIKICAIGPKTSASVESLGIRVDAVPKKYIAEGVIEEMKKHGIHFEVVPGVSAATSVPAYAGIPLTHRDFNSSIALITGHEDPSKGGSKIEWKGLSTCIENLIFFMGAKNLSTIVKKLIENGRNPDTPIAVIRWGTTPLQETIVGRLNDITEKAKNIKPPAIIVVGEVVALREKLNWFEKKSLFGKRILITRPRGQAESFVELLEKEGAIAIQFPTIETVPPDSWDALDNAIKKLDTYQWLIFTSANGVRFFMERLKANKKDIRELKGIKICAIGPKTAASIESLGIKVNAIPEKYIAEGVIEEMQKYGVKGKKILLPRASVARDILPQELKKMGAEIDVVDTYKTVKPVEKANEIKNMLKNGEIDVITFTSSSTVQNFMSYFNTDKKMLKDIIIASIGPITAKTVEEFGLKNAIVSDEHTIERFTEKIIEYFRRKENG